MTTQFLSSLFTTLAQVSFTLTGLLAIAVAGDNYRRVFWFGDKSRSTFISICFLLLVLPGFVSIGGLIVPPFETRIPTWPIATIILGSAYFLLSFFYTYIRKKLAEPEEFKKLGKSLFVVIFEMGFYGFFMIIFGAWGYFFYSKFPIANHNPAETLMGILLFVIIFSAVLISFRLLQTPEQPAKLSENINIIPPSSRSIVVNQKTNAGINVITALLIAVISFGAGLFLKTRSK